MKKRVVSMLTVICLMSMLFSASVFASDVDTAAPENQQFTQEEMSEMVQQNIIYQEDTFTKTAIVTIP